MTRRANKKLPDAPGVTLHFLPHERAFLKWNEPGPSGLMGGYQNEENWLILNIDKSTGRCALDPIHFERICRYCRPDPRGYGPGGPNGRIRAACIPALRRAGIDLAAEWRAGRAA